MSTGTIHLSQGQSPRNQAVDFLVAPAAMPRVGQSALWKYKGIYLQVAKRVGYWFSIVSSPEAGL